LRQGFHLSKLHAIVWKQKLQKAWASAETFPGGGQSRHFAYSSQVVDDATQMFLHKTLHLFYTTKKMTNVTATVA